MVRDLLNSSRERKPNTQQEALMNAQVVTHRKSTRNTRQTRPVPEMLLELAYYLHTTSVVGKSRTLTAQSRDRQSPNR
jgi:hypothetical protein